jgi:hypothetical protein
MKATARTTLGTVVAALALVAFAYNARDLYRWIRIARM